MAPQPMMMAQPMSGMPMGGMPMGGMPMMGAPMGMPMMGAPMGIPMGGMPMGGMPMGRHAHGRHALLNVNSWCTRIHCRGLQTSRLSRRSALQAFLSWNGLQAAAETP